MSYHRGYGDVLDDLNRFSQNITTPFIDTPSISTPLSTGRTGVAREDLIVSGRLTDDPRYTKMLAVNVPAGEAVRTVAPTAPDAPKTGLSTGKATQDTRFQTGSGVSLPGDDEGDIPPDDAGGSGGCPTGAVICQDPTTGKVGCCCDEAHGYTPTPDFKSCMKKTTAGGGAPAVGGGGGGGMAVAAAGAAALALLFLRK